VGLPAVENSRSVNVGHCRKIMPIEQNSGGSSHTICGTLWNWALAATTTNTDTVDNISLLGLVTKTARLVWTRWAGSTVDDVQLSKLYYALSAKFNECIAETPMMSTIFQFACPRTEIRSIEVDRDRLKESSFFFILPPSIVHGEGIEAHQTASSSGFPRDI
jgi:hypothetical protein